MLFELELLSEFPLLFKCKNLPLPSPVNIVEAAPAPLMVRLLVPSGMVIPSSE